jgi:hypothetical protein
MAVLIERFSKNIIKALIDAEEQIFQFISIEPLYKNRE